MTLTFISPIALIDLYLIVFSVNVDGHKPLGTQVGTMIRQAKRKDKAAIKAAKIGG